MNAMIHSRDILNSLPLLAAVLGRNYGVEVRIGGNETKTNGKVIFIPALPKDCEAELLGYARGYIDHEAAHIRHSDFKVLKAARLDTVAFTIANIIEDWRIEQRQAEIFPGCRCHFDWLTRKFCLERKQEETEKAGENPAFSILEYLLLAVSSWTVPEVVKTLRPVQVRLDAQFPGLSAQMDAVLDRVHGNCPDTAAVIAHARELAELIRQWHVPESQQEEDTETQDTGSGGNPSSKQGEKESQCRGTDGLGKLESTNKNQGEESHCASSSGKAKADAGDCDPQTDEHEAEPDHQSAQAAADMESRIAELFSLAAEDMPHTKGQLAAQTLTSSHVQHIGPAMSVAVEGHARSHSVSSKEKEEAMRISIALRNRLQGLLQAHTRKNVGIGRQGKLDTSRLYRLRIGDPRLFRIKEERLTLNTAVHVLLDVSYSMRGEAIALARKACFAIAKALHGVSGVNVALTAFPAQWPNDSVCPLMRHGAALPPFLNVDACGGTPLAPALWWVMQNMLSLKEERKLILVVTDGQPDSQDASVIALDAAKKAGFEVYGIVIRNECIARLLPKSSQIVWNLAELPKAMFGLLQGVLMQGGKYVCSS